ncbi:MAG: AraC family transcriptional regulator [Pseudomonadota bacterium]
MGQALSLDCFTEAAAAKTTVLHSFNGRRIRASRLVRRTAGVAPTEARRSHSLIFQLGGGTAYRHDGGRNTEKNRPGGTTLIPANVTSAWDLSEGIELLQMQISDSYLRRFASLEFDIDADRLEMHDRIDVEDPFVRDLAGLVLQELKRDQGPSDMLLEHFDSVLSGHILRSYSNMSDLVDTQTMTERGRKDEEAVRRAQEILLDRLSENISADDLARTLGISPFRLMRCFKAELGVSIHRFVMESRVAFVRDRLLHSDDRLIAIALDAGFASQSHMTSSYTSLVGISPGRHRRQMRGG